MTELALVPLAMAAPDGVPPEIASVCSLTEAGLRYWSSTKALAELKRDGTDGGVPAAAAQASAALAAADHNRLTDRLTALGMMMAPNRPAAESSVWLGEMCRLLGDLPEDILAEAIDEHVRTSKFLPTVAEIRARADPVMAARRRLFSQLDAMARLIASGVQIAPAPPKRDETRRPVDDGPITEDQAAELNGIMAKIGATSRYRPDGSRFTVDPETERPRETGPRRMPTFQDYVDMGADPEDVRRCLGERAASG